MLSFELLYVLENKTCWVNCFVYDKKRSWNFSRNTYTRIYSMKFVNPPDVATTDTDKIVI